MNLPAQIAKNLRAVYVGENWTDVNLKDSLADLTWKEVTTKVYSFNTIAALVYHINYYVRAALKVLQGERLDAKDIYSFDHKPIQKQADWEELLQETFTDAENLAKQVEQLPEHKLEEIFIHEKYGSYYRNLHGIIEHTHYHLGQIVLLRKLAKLANEN